MTATSHPSAAIEGVLMATFVADAIGGPWEGSGAVSLNEARRRLATSLEAAVLRYTDDTQLTLALAEHLCVHPDVEPAALVATFLDHFEDWRGYARGMHGLVAAWSRGLAPAEAATAVFPDGSFGNGAAMRVAPVGVLHAGDPPRAARAARRQAAVTHAHPIGIDAAIAQTRAVTAATVNGSFGPDDIAVVAAGATTPEVQTCLSTAAEQVAAWRHTRDPVAVSAAIGTDVVASQSVAAALWIGAVADDIEEAVVLALALGGDIDTIAAMGAAVLGATGATPPPAWTERLEDGARGRSYVRDLARRLTAVAAQLPPEGDMAADGE